MKVHSSQQIPWKDVEIVKDKKARYHTYHRMALVLVLVFLVLALCVFSLRYLWRPNVGKVYDHQYKAVLDGVETESMMEIHPRQHVEIFRMGKGNEEVLEVHDFKNGITGIRFAEHQRCYIRTQTRKLPTVAAIAAEDRALVVDDEMEAMDMKVDDSHVWVPAEKPIANPAFLFNSKIWEICQELPIHWIHPSPLSDSDLHDVGNVDKPGAEGTDSDLRDVGIVDKPDAEGTDSDLHAVDKPGTEGTDSEGNVDKPDSEDTGHRFIRDITDHLGVNDYRDAGMELENHLDDRGYCCQHCRRGYRYCRRYHEPLGGFNPWPYYYQGGRVICQIVMPCNWWIARMLGRV